jgi:hypothetical protein
MAFLSAVGLIQLRRGDEGIQYMDDNQSNPLDGLDADFSGLPAAT